MGTWEWMRDRQSKEGRRMDEERWKSKGREGYVEGKGRRKDI